MKKGTELIPLVTPGEVLAEEFLKPLSITGKTLAEKTRLKTSRISEIVHGKRRISAEVAMRLGLAFGTTPQFWMNLQSQYDYEKAEREYGSLIRKEVQQLEMA